MIFSTFPCDWNYYGAAKLLVGEASANIVVSVNMTFERQTEIVVKVLWENFEQEKIRLLPFFESHQIQYIHIVEDHSLILEGFINPPWEKKADNFQTINIVTSRKITQDNIPGIQFGKSVSLKSYLNNAVSLWDKQSFNQEFLGIPKQRKDLFEEQPKNNYIECTNNYDFCCGVSYIKNQSRQLISDKSLESFYKLSFFEIRDIRSYLSEIIVSNIFLALGQISQAVCDVCWYLSIRTKKNIMPIFQTYHIESVNFLSSGFLIRVATNIYLNEKNYFLTGYSFNTQELIESIIECEPLPHKISRGLSALYLTTYKVPAELELMTSFSAIEYFYSYWFLELKGYEMLKKLIKDPSFPKESRKYRKSLEKINEKIDKSLSDYSLGKGQTPSISLVMPFFLQLLDVDSTKYGVCFDKTDFIQIRNDLLHGGNVQDENTLFTAAHKAHFMAEEILFILLQRISGSSKKNLYQSPQQSISSDSFTMPIINPTIYELIT